MELLLGIALGSLSAFVFIFIGAGYGYAIAKHESGEIIKKEELGKKEIMVKQ